MSAVEDYIWRFVCGAMHSQAHRRNSMAFERCKAYPVNQLSYATASVVHAILCEEHARFVSPCTLDAYKLAMPQAVVMPLAGTVTGFSVCFICQGSAWLGVRNVRVKQRIM